MSYNYLAKLMVSFGKIRVSPKCLSYHHMCLSLLIVLDTLLKRTPTKAFTASGLEVCGNLSESQQCG